MSKLSLPDTCPGISKFVRPTPESIACHKCGRILEIWSDEQETKCEACGVIIFREKGDFCLDYCEYADKCREIINKKKLG